MKTPKEKKTFHASPIRDPAKIEAAILRMTLAALSSELGDSRSQLRIDDKFTDSESRRERALKAILETEGQGGPDRDAAATLLASYVEALVCRRPSNKDVEKELRSLATFIDEKRTLRKRKRHGEIAVVNAVSSLLKSKGSMPTIAEIDALLIEREIKIGDNIRNKALDLIMETTGHPYPRAPRNS